MPLGSRSSIAVAVVVAAGLALPVAASACSTDEYLTAEERESGLYDTTPPDYYAGSSAPHTHGEEGAPAEAPVAEPVKAEEPAQTRAPKKQAPRTRSSAPAGGRGEAAQPAPAPAPVAPPVEVAAAAPVTAPAVTPQLPVVIEDTAAQARAEQRAARARSLARARTLLQAARREARALARTQAFVASRTDRPRLHFEIGAPEAVPVAATPGRAAYGWEWAWTILLALIAVAAARAALLRRPAARKPVLALDPAIEFDPVEAELQEILAQELARREDAVAAGTPAGR